MTEKLNFTSIGIDDAFALCCARKWEETRQYAYSDRSNFSVFYKESLREVYGFKINNIFVIGSVTPQKTVLCLSSYTLTGLMSDIPKVNGKTSTILCCGYYDPVSAQSQMNSWKTARCSNRRPTTVNQIDFTFSDMDGIPVVLDPGTKIVIDYSVFIDSYNCKCKK
jgi:hypothetical protein